MPKENSDIGVLIQQNNIDFLLRERKGIRKKAENFLTTISYCKVVTVILIYNLKLLKYLNNKLKRTLFISNVNSLLHYYYFVIICSFQRYSYVFE